MTQKMKQRLTGLALIILGIIAMPIDSDITGSVFLWMMGVIAFFG